MTWCKKDPEDETMIAYVFKTKECDGSTETLYFTSEDFVSYCMLERIRNAWVESITLVENEFGKQYTAVLYED